MKKSLVVLALAALSASAFAADANLQAGVRLGQHHAEYAVDGATHQDKQGVAAEAFVRRAVNDKTSVEFSALDIGRVGLDRGTHHTYMHARAVGVEAVRLLGSDGKLHAVARAGLAYTMGYAAGDHGDRLTPTVGLGLSYDLTPDLALEASWKHLHGVGFSDTKVDTLTIGTAFRF